MVLIGMLFSDVLSACACICDIEFLLTTEGTGSLETKGAQVFTIVCHDPY